MGEEDLQTLRNELRDYRATVREARANEAAAKRESARSAKEARLARAELEAAKEVPKSRQPEVGRADHRKQWESGVRSPFVALLGICLGALVAYLVFLPTGADHDVVPSAAQSGLSQVEGGIRDCVNGVDVDCDEVDAGRPGGAQSSYAAARHLTATRQVFEIACPPLTRVVGAELSAAVPSDPAVDTGSSGVPTAAIGGDRSRHEDEQDQSEASEQLLRKIVAAPSLVDMPRREAVSKIRSLGLTPVTVFEFRPEGGQLHDQVVSQSPSPGVELVPGRDQIEITYVWDDDDRDVRVDLVMPTPQLVGLTVDAAIELAECMGVPVAQISADPGADISSGLGIVVAQMPEPGTPAQSVRITIRS